MGTKLALAGLALAACHCAEIQNPADSAPVVAELVDIEDDGAYCTAFHLQGNLWGTAGHCGEYALEHPSSINHVPVTGVKVSKTDDVALMIAGAGVPSARLGTLPSFGDPVYYIGYPHYGGEIHKGAYSGYWGTESKMAEGYEITGMMVDGGASGSPVFDRSGLVVGVVVSSFRGTTYSYCEPVTALDALLKDKASFRAPAAEPPDMMDLDALIKELLAP